MIDVISNATSKDIMQKMFLDFLRSRSLKVNEHTLTLILSLVEDHNLCSMIHLYAMKNYLYGVRVNVFIISDYVRCAWIIMAIKVFGDMDRAMLNVYSDNRLIYAYGV